MSKWCQIVCVFNQVANFQIFRKWEKEKISQTVQRILKEKFEFIEGNRQKNPRI